jgi:uncharacterized membrane protein YhdT
MDKRLIFLLLFAFLLFPIIDAKPSITTSEVGGISIISPTFEYHQVNTSFDFYWHISNSTTLLTNTTATCVFHLYDKQDKSEHIMDVNPVKLFVHNRDFEVVANATNFTKMGDYCMLIECNTSLQTGWREQCFEVNYKGQELSVAQSILNSSLFLILILFMLAVFFMIINLPEDNDRDGEGQIMSINYLKYLRTSLWIAEWMLMVAVLYISSNIAFAYLSTNLFGKILFTLFQITFGLTPLIVIVLVVYMFVRFFHDREFQNLLNRGFFPEGKL